MILADKIIDLRKKNGWSQEELAEYESFYIDTDAGTCVAGENEIIPGEYIIESGWEAVALEITEPSGKTETVNCCNLRIVDQSRLSFQMFIFRILF